MKRWVALLRAVNVSGTAKLPMEALRDALSNIGLSHVRTHAASGNVVFDSDQSNEEISPAINGALEEKFGLSGHRTILRDAQTFLQLPRLNPLAEAAKQRPNMLHVHFPAGPLRAEAEFNLTSYKGPERIRLNAGHVFIDYVNGAGESKLTPRFLESCLGVQGTSRNWNTIQALLQMIDND